MDPEPKAAHNFSRTHAGDADYADVASVAILLTHGAPGGPLADVERSKVPAFAKLGVSGEIEVIEMPDTHDAYVWNLKMLGG